MDGLARIEAGIGKIIDFIDGLMNVEYSGYAFNTADEGCGNCG